MKDTGSHLGAERETRRVRPNVSLRLADQWPVVERLYQLEGESAFSPLAKKAFAVLAEKHGLSFPDKEEGAHD